MILIRNHIRLTVFSEKVFKGHHEILAENIIIELGSPVVIITPDLIVEKTKGLCQKEKIWGFNANIACNNRSTIIIKDFKYFTLAAYSNSEVFLSHVKVYNATNFFRLNNLNIYRLDSENSNALIVDSNINELYIGIERWHTDRLRKNTNGDVVNIKTDIRKSIIDRCKIYIKHDKLNLQESNIGELTIYSSIRILHSWQGNAIRRININGNIDQLKIEDSSIEVIKGVKEAKIKELIVKDSSIVNIYGLYETNINSKNSDSLLFIAESYKNSRNKEKQFEYAYLYQKEITKGITAKHKKLWRYILDITCGYGYKPERGFYFLFGVWLIFSIFYTLISFFKGYGLKIDGTEVSGFKNILLYALYFSAITFTTVGYGDVVPIDWLTRILASIEAILGVSIMAIIIYALTKHE